MKPVLSILMVFALMASCKNEAKIRNEIQSSLNQCVLAVSTKNIDLYMEGIPDDFEIKDENGEIITREMQRELALRDWAIIDTTLSNSYKVNSLKADGNNATVYTFQKWTRIMYRRDGITTDTVLTTQRHKEIWKRNKDKWVNYEIEELGGKIYLNGEEYIT